MEHYGFVHQRSNHGLKEPHKPHSIVPADAPTPSGSQALCERRALRGKPADAAPRTAPRCAVVSGTRLVCYTFRMNQEDRVTTYMFRVVLEPDEDRWRAYSPALEAQGASTWGHTREEALQNIREVLEMIAAELVEEGKQVPSDVAPSDAPLVAVTV